MRESVEKAKEAVAEDVQDGTSWSEYFSLQPLTLNNRPLLCTHTHTHTIKKIPVILGNAYLSMFFTTSSEPKLLKQSMSAYQQAVRHSLLFSIPSLLFLPPTCRHREQERDSGVANNPDLHFNKATVRVN